MIIIIAIADGPRALLRLPTAFQRDPKTAFPCAALVLHVFDFGDRTSPSFDIRCLLSAVLPWGGPATIFVMCLLIKFPTQDTKSTAVTLGAGILAHFSSNFMRLSYAFVYS
jgi:hypothetical protein